MDKVYRVISVEDDDAQFKLLQLTLRGLPIQLYHIETGKLAIAILSRIKPDLLLLDIRLPDMRGWDVLDELADSRRLENVPILVLTVHRETAHRVIARLQQVTDYIIKPFAPHELRERIKKILGIEDMEDPGIHGHGTD